MGIKVRVLKSIAWAIDPPNPGEIYLVEGQVRDDIPDHMIEQMLASETDWIEILDDEAAQSDSTEESEDVQEIRNTLNDIVANAVNKVDAKDDLENWAIDNLGFDVNKRKKLEEVIEDIIEAYKAG